MAARMNPHVNYILDKIYASATASEAKKKLEEVCAKAELEGEGITLETLTALKYAQLGMVDAMWESAEEWLGCPNGRAEWDSFGLKRHLRKLATGNEANHILWGRAQADNPDLPAPVDDYVQRLSHFLTGFASMCNINF